MDYWIIIANLFSIYKLTTSKNIDFDYLVFSQRWLPSACIEYEEKDPSSNVCILPSNYTVWGVHGLWPTQTSKNIGPFFCNRTMKFDFNTLKPFLLDLEMYWPNIEKKTSLQSFWKHEWDKHGTCAAQLEPLNSEVKYFSTGLSFFHQYDLQKILHFNISHDNFIASERNFNSLFNILKNSFGKDPFIKCITEIKTKRAFLSEIELCFDKSLELIDCKKKNSKLTNCPLDFPIVIPDKINQSSTEIISRSYYEKLLKLLNALIFLQWAL